MIEQVKQSSNFLRENGVGEPVAGVILGTGLGQFVEHLEKSVTIPYSEIPHFPQATVEFHKGQLVFGLLDGVPVLIMQGRFHYYEGYSMQQIAFPVHVMQDLGIDYLLISNAAGSINNNYRKGSLMLLDDHINLLPANPLVGKNIDSLGPRFPDMSAPYNSEMNNSIMAIAKELGITLHKGVYAAVPGPNLETRAEYRYLSRIGADAVGMSTVPEVIASNHMGLPCSVISVLTDECDPDNLKPVDIADIIAIAGKAEPDMIALFRSQIAKSNKILN